MTNTPCELYRREQESLERQRKQKEEYERLRGYDFLRALYEMACPEVKE